MASLYSGYGSPGDMFEIGGTLLDSDEVAVAKPAADTTPAKTEHARSDVS